MAFDHTIWEYMGVFERLSNMIDNDIHTYMYSHSQKFRSVFQKESLQCTYSHSEKFRSIFQIVYSVHTVTPKCSAASFRKFTVYNCKLSFWKTLRNFWEWLYDSFKSACEIWVNVNNNYVLISFVFFTLKLPKLFYVPLMIKFTGKLLQLPNNDRKHLQI